MSRKIAINTIKTLILGIYAISNLSCSSQKTEVGFKILVDPRIELMNIALTFTDLPYFGKISDEKYEYYQDVIKHFSSQRNHEAIKRCVSFPYFLDISFPDQMVLYLSDPPNMGLKYTPPANITKQVLDDILQFVSVLNQFAIDSKFMNFWEDHQRYYDSITYSLQNKLPYHEYLSLVNDFYGVKSSEFVCVISPILMGAAFGPALDVEGKRVPYFVTGPDRIEDGKPIFTDKWLRLLIFHEYGHSFVSPLCEKYRDQIMVRDSLLNYFNQNDVIRSTYDNWFTVVNEQITRGCENFLLRKAGYIQESRENIERNLNHGFVLLPSVVRKFEYYDTHREMYPTLESFFPEILKVFDEMDFSVFSIMEQSDAKIKSEEETLQVSSDSVGLTVEQVKLIVENFFKNFNRKDLGAIKSSLHSNVSVSKQKNEMALLILQSAMEQILAFDNYTVSKIEKVNENIKITGKYQIKNDDSDYTFLLDGNGKFLIIDMFQIKTN